MSWVAVGGAAVGLVGNYMNKKNAASNSTNGGAGTTTVDKAPWSEAAPWLTQNLGMGQALQQQYQAQPFSQAQTAAYGNSAGQADYMRSLIPSLLGQMGGQQVGFDRNNPTAKPTAWNFGPGSLAQTQNTNVAGLLAAQPTVIDPNKAATDAASYIAAAAPAPAAAASSGGGALDSLYNIQKKIDPLGGAVTKFLGKLF